MILNDVAVIDPSGFNASCASPAEPRVKSPLCVNSRDFVGFRVAIDNANPLPCAIPTPPTSPKINVSASSYASPPTVTAAAAVSYTHLTLPTTPYV